VVFTTSKGSTSIPKIPLGLSIDGSSNTWGRAWGHFQPIGWIQFSGCESISGNHQGRVWQTNSVQNHVGMGLCPELAMETQVKWVASCQSSWISKSWLNSLGVISHAMIPPRKQC
jgi:hypothetical protein